MFLGFRAAFVLGFAGLLGLATTSGHADIRGVEEAQAPGAGQVPTTSSAASSIDAANSALARGDYANALKLLTALHEQNPKDPQVLYDLGLTTEALHPDATAEAEADYRAASAANPLFTLPHVALGLLLARSGRAADAREQLLTATRIPDIQPDLKARALRAMARLDLNARNTPVASDELAQALQLTPETPDDTLLLAEIAEATPDLETAEKAYRRYLSGRANDTNGTAALAHVLVAEHRPSEAESVLREGMVAHPDDLALTSQLATTLLASGDDAKVAQAAPLLERLNAAHPDDPNVARLLARMYVETGHADKAEALYAKLTSGGAGASDPALLDDYGETLLRLHRPAEAEKILKLAVANRTGFATPADFADAAMHLAFAAQEIDDPREALRALDLRGTVTPPSLPALFLEATARDTLHQSSQAVDLYKRFLVEAHGTLPEQEAKARERVAALGVRR